MRWAHTPSHRCKGSLEQHKSIRYQRAPYYLYTPEMWQMLEILDDDDSYNKYHHYVCAIKYCPFCGEKLPEVEG